MSRNDNFQQTAFYTDDHAKITIVSKISGKKIAQLIRDSLKPNFNDPRRFGVDSMTAARIKTALQKLAEGK